MPKLVTSIGSWWLCPCPGRTCATASGRRRHASEPQWPSGTNVPLPRAIPDSSQRVGGEWAISNNELSTTSTRFAVHIRERQLVLTPTTNLSSCR